MKVAKAKGRLRGKQPKLTRRQEAHLVSLLASGDYSTAEVSELFGVGRSTLYRAIERQHDHALVVEIAASTSDWADPDRTRCPAQVPSRACLARTNARGSYMGWRGRVVVTVLGGVPAAIGLQASVVCVARGGDCREDGRRPRPRLGSGPGP